MKSKRKVVKMVTERLCCDTDDMRPVPGTRYRDGIPMQVVCRHCGQRHQYVRFTDAAGSGDWRFDPVIQDAK